MPLRVCIAIPSKDRHDSLNKTLSSALACKVPILICDQSDEPYQPDTEQDSGQLVKVYHRPLIRSLPAARNMLLEASTAFDLVIFIDDDSDLAPSFVTICQQLAAEKPDCPAWGPVIEQRSRWQQRLSRLSQWGCFRDERRLTSGPNERQSRALFGCAFVVRRAAAQAIGGFDTSRLGYALGEDFDFFLRLSQRWGRSGFSKDLHAVHREDGTNRASPLNRGAAKARYWVFLARRHGGGNPATLLHLGLALCGAASGLGREPGAALGVLKGLFSLNHDRVSRVTPIPAKPH